MGEQIRQLIVCCDGTNNNITGHACDTSVVKLCELLSQRSDDDQIVFYDPGVGNPGDLPGATWRDSIRLFGNRVAGLAFGRGVYENMVQAYKFLMDHYRPGDQIYILGFSRGAFTARSVAGMVNKFGILRPQAKVMVPTLVHLYFSKKSGKRSDRDVVAEQARKLFAAEQSRKVPVHFTGVWDTVASVGMFPFDTKFTALPNLQGKHFVHVRQALALDELRAQFRPRLYWGENGPHTCEDGRPGTLLQLWFRGSHCDVGGGYAREDSALATVPLAWMLSEATQLGLRVNGGAALSEAQALELLAHEPGHSEGRPLIHSQMHANPAWAVTGMELRVTDKVLLDEHADEPIRPQEHPSVAAWKPAFPQGTVWAKRRSAAWPLKSLVAMVLAACLYAWLLAGTAKLPAMWLASCLFSQWQLLALLEPSWIESAAQESHWSWALLVDTLALIPAYTCLLTFFAVQAFAVCAGDRRVHSPRPAWLKPLGWSLTVAVFADLGENAFTWICLGLLHYAHNHLAWVAALLMMILSACKWIGILGALMLILIGMLKGLTHRRASNS